MREPARSGADEPAALPEPPPERVWAWGMSTSALSRVHRPTSLDGVRDVLAFARDRGCHVGLRGAGQSYGDAALSDGQLGLDLSRLNAIRAWDPEHGIVRLEPGVTIGQLWRHALVDGWWPSVVPGTMFATLGGAAAANIHGKNNWKVGPLGEHVVSCDVLLADGELVTCGPDTRPELFHAVLGSFGMLGCIVALSLRLKRIHSGLVRVRPITVPDLGAMIGVFEEHHGDADYLVGWVDCLAAGAALGRGLVHRADHLRPGEDPDPARSQRVTSQDLPSTILGVVPKSVVWRCMRPLTNDLGVRVVNAVKYRLGRHERRASCLQSHAAFNFLLDYVPGWKRAYGPGGLIQYQSFIPAEAAEAAFGAQLRLAQARGLLPYLGVFKRHRRDAFLLTHAVDGYSLALDFRVTRANRARLWSLAAELDRIVLDAGGRFYLAKDSTLRPETFAASLGAERLQRFHALKRQWDPRGLFQTDLARRLLAPVG